MTKTANYRTPAARRVLPANAPREAWLAERQKGIGASDTSAVLGLNEYKSRMDVWLEKTGQVVDDFEGNEATYWGSAQEGIMRRRFTEDTGITVRQSGLLESREHSFLRYTPDGITEDGGLLEMKTAGDYTAADWEDGVADHAALQIQKGMLVTGRTHAHVTVLIKGRDWRTYVVEQDADLQQIILDAELDFWNSHVVPVVPPAIRPNDLDAIKRFYPTAIPDSPLDVEDPGAPLWGLLEQLDTAKAGVKSAEANVDRIAGEVRLFMGDHDAVMHGGKVAVKLANDGTFSSSKFKAARPELWEQLQVEKPVLDMDTLKASHADVYTEYRARTLRVLKAAPIRKGV